MRTRAIGGASQFADELPWVNRSSLNFSDDAQRARIRPGDRRILAPALSPNLPGAWKFKVAMHSEFRDDPAKAAQNVAQPGKIARGAFRQNHTACIAAGAGADL